MSEAKTEVALVSLPTVPAELEQAFTNDAYIDGLIKEVRQKASSEVGDVKTAKGRAVYVRMAAKVRSAKVMIDAAGKALVAEMKARPAMVDASRRKVREALEALATEIRQPVTDYEAEQERIAAEKEAEESRQWQEAEARREAELLAQQKDAHHEVALLLNEKYDRDLADRLAAQERQRIENEERIRREAAEQAKREAEERHQAELSAAARREAEQQAAIERAERLRVEEQQKAERDRQAAIEDAKREQEAAIQRERAAAKAKEDTRLAEQQRLADEAAARAANVEHKRKINRAAVAALVTAGLTEELAVKAVTAIATGKVPNTSIQY